MTQSNMPSEINCPHCGQTYAIQPAQWPQYQGRSIGCTKCGQTFVVGASAQGAAALPPPLAPGYPQQGYGYPPPKKGMSGGVIVAIIFGILCVLAIPCLIGISILLPALNKVRQEALKAKCASNLKMIAAGLVTYSNSNNGNYPDSMVTLIRASGAPPTIYICPDSADTPLTKPLTSVTAADLAGHCSYIYVAGGMNSNVGSDEVLVYESLSDHHARGINVLYGDYHVAWVPISTARQMIQSLPASPPANPPAASGP